MSRDSSSAERPVLYVHVADDGGLFVIDEDGRSAWVRQDELLHYVGAIRDRGGSVLLSQERGSPVAESALRAIADFRVTLTRSPEVHPDAVRGEGATALMSAAYLGKIELLRDLLQRGVDVASRDIDGFDALMYAANGGQEEAVSLLVERGADPNQIDRDGSTALMLAAQRGDIKIVKRLLVAGADPRTSRKTDGLKAVDFAAGNGHERVAAVLAAAERVRQ